MKTKLMIAFFSIVILASCAKKEELPSLDSIYGTYNGTLSTTTNSMDAYCEITKIDVTYASMGIGQPGSGPSMGVDSMSVAATTTNYTLSINGTSIGNVDGKTLSWSDGFYTFTGTK